MNSQRAFHVERVAKERLNEVIAAQQLAQEQASLAEEAASVAVRRDDAEAEALIRRVLNEQKTRLELY